MINRPSGSLLIKEACIECDCVFVAEDVYWHILRDIQLRMSARPDGRGVRYVRTHVRTYAQAGNKFKEALVLDSRPIC